jgi:hypothetical protein
MPTRQPFYSGKASIFAIGMLISQAAFAQITEITTRPADVDAIDFGQFNLLPSDSISAPQPFESFGGIKGSIDRGIGTPLSLSMQFCFCRLGAEGETGFTGNYMTGDWLIRADPPGQITIHFKKPVRLVGTQLSNNYGGPFVAHIQAFKNKKLVGTFTENGNLTSTADNTAIFLGVMDTTAGITDVTIP